MSTPYTHQEYPKMVGGRIVKDADEEAQHRSTVAATAPVVKGDGDPLAEVLNASAAAACAAISAGEFTPEQLASLSGLETAGKGRKTVLAAIEAKKTE